MTKVWIVRAGDGATVGDIVRKAHADESAIADGRVFVGKKRATAATQPVKVGDTVRVGAAASAAPPIEVLFQRAGVVACIKPAGLPTVPDHAGAAHSLVALVARQIGARVEALRITSRLDREVSGVVLFALDASAEEKLRAARAAGTYRRRYVAIAAGARGADAGAAGARGVDASASAGEWSAPIGRAKDPLLRAVGGADAKESLTRWRVVATGEGTLLLAVEPETGRTHQIRVHASHAGWPLLGDRDYGGPTRLTLANGAIVAPSRIALHAARVEVAGFVAEAPIPRELRDLWRACGGHDDAWLAACT
ncbi:MAG: RluA family pseudouridine synthase [Labilithrix sp.]|nr:RluA family pseudouridine synthase [Labilithrix sp.]MCW5810583.1 RluA family pseudouridine synthase [Labilithrix sp.]